MEGAQQKKLLYHLTDLDNLPSIAAGGLRSRRSLAASADRFVDHGDPEILAGRSQFDLDCYVPFHFIHKSPFDYAVVRRSPARRYVLIAVRRDFAAASGWRICPKHPLTDSEPPMVLDWARGFGQVDWDQMDKRPRDYDSDRECKLSCMAEALSPVAVPVSRWQCVYVATDHTSRLVRSILGVGIFINVNPGMFPGGAR